MSDVLALRHRYQYDLVLLLTSVGNFRLSSLCSELDVDIDADGFVTHRQTPSSVTVEAPSAQPPVAAVQAAELETKAPTAAGLAAGARTLFPLTHMASLEAADQIHALNAKLMRLSPQKDPEDVLQQLEFHQRLHVRYEKGELRKCMMSAYLYMTKEWRYDFLAYMRSELMSDYERKDDSVIPELSLLLAKIPASSEGFADKGFERTCRFTQLSFTLVPPDFCASGA